MATTQYAAPDLHVAYTENDVNGGLSGYGQVLQEVTLAPLLGGLGQVPFVISGFTLPSSGGSSGRVIGQNGQAHIGGYLLQGGATGFSVSFPYANSWVFLRLLKTAGKVTSAIVEVNDTNVAPADSCKLGRVLTSGGTISSSVDLRHFHRLTCGSILGVNGTTPLIYKHGSGNWTVSGTSDTPGSVQIDYDVAYNRIPITLFNEALWAVPTASYLKIHGAQSLSNGVEYHFAVYG